MSTPTYPDFLRALAAAHEAQAAAHDMYVYAERLLRSFGPPGSGMEAMHADFARDYRKRAEIARAQADRQQVEDERWNAHMAAMEAASHNH